MEYLVKITNSKPLTVSFAFCNPLGDGGDVFVPRLLEPLGAFVRWQVRDATGAVVCETHIPKFNSKLDPSKDESYLPLGTGYSFGVLLAMDADDCTLAKGEYRMRLTYTNLNYRGTVARPVGELAHSVELPLRVD